MTKSLILMSFATYALFFMLLSIHNINAQENNTETVLANDTSLQNKTAVVLETENNETVIIIGEVGDNLTTTNTTAERVGSTITNLLNKTGIIISNLPETLEIATERGGSIISNVSGPAGNVFENITGKIISLFE